jgi:hypothetical protein
MFGAVDAERRSRALTWQQVAHEIGGVTASNLTRLAKGGRIGISQAIRITEWLGCSVGNFTKTEVRA